MSQQPSTCSTGSLTRPGRKPCLPLPTHPHHRSPAPCGAAQGTLNKAQWLIVLLQDQGGLACWELATKNSPASQAGRQYVGPAAYLPRGSNAVGLSLATTLDVVQLDHIPDHPDQRTKVKD